MTPRKTAPRKADSSSDAEARLAGFLAKFTPEIETFATAAIGQMRTLLPGAHQLVYDNYNALAIGFAPSERTSEAVFSIAVFPRWVSLFFLRGKGLPDPDGLLKGTGNVVRHIVLKTPQELNSAPLRKLMDTAMDAAEFVPGKDPAGKLVIKSVSARQRPRRPV